MARSLLTSLRPGQWTKNLLVFAGVLFARRLLDTGAVFEAGAAFVIFCALSSVAYLVNDIADRDGDRQHPIKAARPIASGALPVSTAATAAVLIGGGALGGALALSREMAAVAAGYLTIQLLYSGVLKHLVIL